MRLLSMISILIIAAFPLACGHAPVLAQGESSNAKTEPAPEPTIKDDKVVFPSGAPQLASLTIENCTAPKDLVLHFNGRLVWNDEVTVNVFTPVGGRVKRILSKLGDDVTTGTSLATIDSPDYGQAQADMRHAESDIRLARKTLTRTQELFDHGAAPKKDLEAAQADLEGKQAELERATAHLKLFGGKSDAVDQQYYLRAPIAGIVVEKNINPGQEVRPDQMLANAAPYFAPHFVISDPKALWVMLDITEKDVALVKPGQELQVTTKAYPGKTFTGKIEVIGNSLDPATRTVKVRGNVENPEMLLKAQMYVAVDVIDGKEPQKGVSVPSMAIFMKGDKHYVFVAEEKERFTRREVVIGPESGDQTVILDGLNADTPVVTKGSLLLESLIEAKGDA